MADIPKSASRKDKEKTVKTPDGLANKQVPGHDAPTSEEIGFIVRREHRRKHREDREF